MRFCGQLLVRLMYGKGPRSLPGFALAKTLTYVPALAKSCFEGLAGRMVRFSPFTLVLISAVVWSLQPVAILLLGANDRQEAVQFLILSNLVSGVVGAIAAIRICGASVFLRYFKRFGRNWSFWGLLLLDGACAAGAFALLTLAAAEDNLATQAVIFEAWPIFAMILLYIAIPKENDLTFASFMAVAVFVAGFGFINIDSLTSGPIQHWSSFYALCSAVLLGGAAAATQKLVYEFPAFKKVRFFPIITALRGAITTALLCVIFWGADQSIAIKVPTAEVLTIALGVGILAALNEVTYHIGTSHSDTNSVALIALFSPVLSPLVLLIFGQDLPDGDFWMGSVFILAGIAFAHREGRNTVQFVTLVTAVLVLGAAVLYTSGSNDPKFFEYLNITSLFYALIQTSAFSRLWSSQLEMERHSRAVLLSLSRRRKPDVRARIRDDINYLKSYGRSNATVSELVLLTVLAACNIGILLFTRENTLLGNSIAFLVGVTSAFLITYCWHMQARIFKLSQQILGVADKHTLIEHFKDRIVNIVFVFFLFGYVFTLIFVDALNSVILTSSP